MLGVGHDAGPGIDVDRWNALIAKGLGHQRGWRGARRNSPPCHWSWESVRRPRKARAEFRRSIRIPVGSSSAVRPCDGPEAACRSITMTVAQPRADGQRSVSISAAGGFGCGQKLVGDFGHGADHDHRPLATGEPACTILAVRRIAVASSTEVPPNFMTTGFMRGQPRDRGRLGQREEQACPGQPGTRHSVPPRRRRRESCCGRAR